MDRAPSDHDADPTAPMRHLGAALQRFDPLAARAALARGADPLARAPGIHLLEHGALRAALGGLHGRRSEESSRELAEALYPELLPKAPGEDAALLLAAALWLGKAGHARALLPLCDPFETCELPRHGELSLWSIAALSGSEEALAHWIPTAAARARELEGSRALRLAAAQGRARACALLAPHCDPNERQDGRDNALLIAAAGACPQTLLALGSVCDTDARDSGGHDALMIASRKGLPGMVEAALSFCDPARLCHAEQDALMIAAASPSPGAALSVQTLLPVSWPAREDSKGQTALALALKERNAQSAAALITPELARRPLKNGLTPLMLAAKAGWPQGVAALLEHSEPFEAARPSKFSDIRGAGRSAVSFAMEDPSYRTLGAMLPKLNPFERVGPFSLLRLVLGEWDEPQHEEQRQAFLDQALAASAHLALPPDCSKEFIHALFCHRGWAERLAPNADWGAACSEHACTALMGAAFGAPEWIERLLPLSDPSARSSRGYTALMWAAYGGHPEAVNALLPLSDPLAVCESHCDALMYAVWSQRESVVRALMPASCLAQRDRRGRNAFFWAMAAGAEPLISLLGPLSDTCGRDLGGKNAFELLLQSPPIVEAPPESRWEAIERLVLAAARVMSEPPEPSCGPSLARSIELAMAGAPRQGAREAAELARAALELIALRQSAAQALPPGAARSGRPRL